jgi:hypothetical protein
MTMFPYCSLMAYSVRTSSDMSLRQSGIKGQQYALYMATQISSMAKAFDNVTHIVVRRNCLLHTKQKLVLHSQGSLEQYNSVLL